MLFGITTLCTGYGLAGLARRFLVWPAAMIWPTTLVNCTLFYTLHDHSRTDPTRANGWSISRYKWFMIVFVGSFLWYWFPGYLFTGLSWFCWITWIWPKNVVVNQLFGGYSGYGLFPITLVRAQSVLLSWVLLTWSRTGASSPATSCPRSSRRSMPSPT